MSRRALPNGKCFEQKSPPRPNALPFLSGTECVRHYGRVEQPAGQLMTFVFIRSFILRIGPVTAFLCLLAPTLVLATDIERVSFSERSDGQGLVVRFHANGPIAAYSEPREVSSGRIEMILFNTSLAADYRADDAEGPVQSYTEDGASGHLIFRFNVGEVMVASAYRDRESNDILLGLTHSEAALVSNRDAPEERPIPVRNASTGSAERSGSPPTIDSGSATSATDDQRGRDGTTPVAGSQWMLNTVVIDPGHGGRDPGAGAHGVLEKNITLDVALKLGKYLQEELGVNVEYTRKDDRFIELRDRGRIANEYGGKLFISLHVNAARAPSAHGAETYFLGMHKSAAARATMERENAVVKMESSPDEYEDMTEEALIRMELTRSAYMSKSEELSELIQDQFTNRVQRRNRGVKQAGFYVLWGASMPAVLVELGFVTNPAEAAFLKSEQGQDYMASAIYRAVRAYKEQYEKGLVTRSLD